MNMRITSIEQLEPVEENCTSIVVELPIGSSDLTYTRFSDDEAAAEYAATTPNKAVLIKQNMLCCRGCDAHLIVEDHT